MIELNDSNFSEYTAAGVTVVDFWAEWCGPCKALAPVFSEVAEKLSAQEIRFAKLNVDESPTIAAGNNVMSIPTIVVFRDGAVLGRIVGARGKEQLEREITELAA